MTHFDESNSAGPNLAKHMLTFMVSGILSSPYVSFPCSSITSDQLYSLVWGCIRRLEACGFKVVAVTCDGASANRKFINLHGSKINTTTSKKSKNAPQRANEHDQQSSNKALYDWKNITYKTTNPFADEDRPI